MSPLSKFLWALLFAATLLPLTFLALLISYFICSFYDAAKDAYIFTNILWETVTECAYEINNNDLS